MAESTNSTSNAPAATVEVKQSRIKNFRVNHPRITRIASLAAGAAVVTVVVSTAKNMKQNRKNLAAAAELAKESLHELSDSVSTPDPVA